MGVKLLTIESGETESDSADLTRGRIVQRFLASSTIAGGLKFQIADRSGTFRDLYDTDDGADVSFNTTVAGNGKWNAVPPALLIGDGLVRAVTTEAQSAEQVIELGVAFMVE